ncbi:MAG: M20/M25/M40 family metallo-hydrolase [Thermomicrobiales bacterium]|nr:M20/M25/M40 family metallo-hydrolase [Thermomicrobiales bacterium]
MTGKSAKLIDKCLNAARTLVDDTIDLTLALTAIPAPTFEEGNRAEFFARALRDRGIEPVTIDDIANVTARVPGRDRSGAMVLAGHLDTVFPIDTPITAERRGDRLFGPGVGDNCLGAAAVAMVPELLKRVGVEPAIDLVLTGNVGEEGLGDLRGVRRVMQETPDLRGLIAVEGHNLGRVTHMAVGSRRIQVRVDGPGGHSWGDFGRPNAIHVAAEIIADLAKIPTPAAPKTTLSTGMISGGISINTIPPTVTFLVDMRSVDHASLIATYEAAERILGRERAGVEVTWELIGDRPAGAVPFKAPIVKHALDTLRELGISPIADASSTDANIAISQGLPAICIGLTSGANAHRPDEYIDVPPIAIGLAQLAALVILAGEELAR